MSKLSREQIEEFRAKIGEFKVRPWQERDQAIADASEKLLQFTLTALCDMALSSLSAEPVAWTKRSEWDDAKAKRQSFNGWRIKYDDCDVPLYTAPHSLLAENARLREALEDIERGPQPINDYQFGIRCGVEDRLLQNDVYQAAEYGYEQGLDYCADIARAALKEGS